MSANTAEVDPHPTHLGQPVYNYIFEQVIGADSSHQGRSSTTISFGQFAAWWARTTAAAERFLDGSFAVEHVQLGLDEVHSAWEQQRRQQQQKQLQQEASLLDASALEAVLVTAARLDWEERHDPSHDAKYFFDAATGGSRWELPEGAQAVREILERAIEHPAAAAHGTHAAVSNPLGAQSSDALYTGSFDFDAGGLSRAATVFAVVDTDNSGTISFAEFSVWWARNKLTSANQSKDHSHSHSHSHDNHTCTCATLSDVEAIWKETFADQGQGVAEHQILSQELSLEQLETVLSAVPNEIWRELFEPVTPPSYDWKGKLGPMLSIADGQATRLSKAVYALMGCYPFVWLFFGMDGAGILNKLGCRRDFLDGDGDHDAGACDFNAAAAAAEIAFHLGGFAWLLGNLVAFHSLRLVHREAAAGGGLARLHAASPQISVPAARSLRRWATGAKVIFGGLAVLCLLAIPLAVVRLVIGAMRGYLEMDVFAGFMAMGIVSATGALCTLYWALSMWLATALVAANLEAAAAAVRAAGAQVDILDAVAWRMTIEEPATALARSVLPELSRGWGTGLLAVGVGQLALAVGLGALAFESRERMMEKGGEYVFIWALWLGAAGAAAVAPLALALAPAAVSTHSDELKDSLTLLRAKDLQAQADRIDALYNFLDQVNNKQGIGFAVGGGVQAPVVDKQYLVGTAIKVYAVIAALVPYLLSSLEEPQAGGAVSAVACEPGWLLTDGSCFRLVGSEDGSDWLTWPAAEVACQALGSNLASIITEAHNDAILALLAASPVGHCWIGLTDAAEEGTFVWSDGGEVGFTGWQSGQPNNDVQEDAQCITSLAGQDCVGMGRGSGWADDPCEADFEDTGRGEVEGQPGCHRVEYPYVCSKHAAPFKAHGGPMLGCVDGSWAIGTAHANPDLPPTIVRHSLLLTFYALVRPSRCCFVKVLCHYCCSCVLRHTACTMPACTTRAPPRSSA